VGDCDPSQRLEHVLDRHAGGVPAVACTGGCAGQTGSLHGHPTGPGRSSSEAVRRVRVAGSGRRRCVTRHYPAAARGPPPAVWGHSAPRRNRRQANRQQVIADLFGIVDLVSLAGAVQLVPHDAPARASSLRHAPGDDLGLTSRRKQRGPAGGSPAVVKIASPVWRSASSMGAGRRRWMPDMLASSPTCTWRA
jgi:hypothetical protein